MATQLDENSILSGGNAAFSEQGVISIMFAGMDGFLRGEGPHVALQHRILNLTGIVLHAVDKETLAFGKGERERVVVRADNGVAAVPIGGQRFVESEMQIARLDRVANYLDAS